MKKAADRSVKVKVIVEPPNPANLTEFNREFQEICLGRDMTKVDAAAEFVEIQQSFTAFMERCNKDPRNVHPDLTDCELRSLARVNPDENIEDEEFYFAHASEHPTMEEFRAAQDPSGYPLRLPIGLRQMNHQIIHEHPGIFDARN